MRSFLKNSAIVVALAAAALATATTAGAEGLFVGFGSDRGDRHNSSVTISFGDVAYGYRDGYWDKGHRWHRWNNDRDYRKYRSRYAKSYRDWNHDRYGNDGWAADRYYGLNNISVGYRDGYWDNGHRWHRWDNDGDYRHFRRHSAGSYRDWDHDQHGGDGWQRGSDDGRRD